MRLDGLKPILWTIIGLQFLAIVAVGIVSVVAVRNVGRLDKLQHADRVLAVKTDRELCQRSNLSRAEIQSDIRSLSRDAPKARIEAAVLKRQSRIPIFDCTSGEPLSPNEQTKYVRFWETHNGVPPIVVNDRITNKPDRRIKRNSASG